MSPATSGALQAPVQQVPVQRPSVETGPIAHFAIRARADPGVLHRVLEPFAKRGLVPTRCEARRAGETLEIEVEMAGMDRDLAEYVGRCLLQIHLVERVLTEEVCRNRTLA